MTFVISVFILFMQFLWKWVDELVGKGLDWKTLSELFSYAALSMVPLALPMAVLLSSLMTFGNLAEHYELASLKSSGLSLLRVMRPLIIFTVIVTIGAFAFSDYLLPYTNLKMLSTLYDIQNQKPELSIPDGVFYNQIEGYTIRVQQKSKDGKGLYGVMIYDQSEGYGNTALTVADSGKMSQTEDKHYLLIELFHGNTYKDITNQERSGITHPFMRTAFKDQVLRLDLSAFKLNRTNEDLFKENQQMLSGDQLVKYIDTMYRRMGEHRDDFYGSMKSGYFMRTDKFCREADTAKTNFSNGNVLDGSTKAEKKKIYEVAINSATNVKSSVESKINELDADKKEILRYQIEFWRKFTYSFACLLMFFIGAPLGAIIRKGGLGMPVVISVIAFIIFWVLSIIGEKLSKEGNVPPEFGMWLGCICFIPLGIWLTRKATADSDMFDPGAITRTIINIGRRIPGFRKKRIGSEVVEIESDDFPKPE